MTSASARVGSYGTAVVFLGPFMDGSETVIFPGRNHVLHTWFHSRLDHNAAHRDQLQQYSGESLVALCSLYNCTVQYMIYCFINVVITKLSIIQVSSAMSKPNLFYEYMK